MLRHCRALFGFSKPFFHQGRGPLLGIGFGRQGPVIDSSPHLARCAMEPLISGWRLSHTSFIFIRLFFRLIYIDLYLYSVYSDCNVSSPEHVLLNRNRNSTPYAHWPGLPCPGQERRRRPDARGA